MKKAYPMGMPKLSEYIQKEKYYFLVSFSHRE